MHVSKRSKKACLMLRGILYMLGGSAFLVGSVVLFPFFSDFLDTTELSAWLFMLGSAFFLYLELTSFFQSDHISLCQRMNLLISILGEILFVSGSICFLPALETPREAMLQYEVGCTLLVWSSGAKIWRILSGKGLTWKDCIAADYLEFYRQLVSGVGSVMFFFGTFVLEINNDDFGKQTVSAVLYTIGGLCSYAQTIMIQQTYCSSQASYDKNSLLASLI